MCSLRGGYLLHHDQQGPFRGPLCPQLINGMTSESRRREHVYDTLSTNGALLVLIFNAGMVLILNAGQHNLHGHELQPRPGTPSPAAEHVAWHTHEVFKGQALTT